MGSRGPISKRAPQSVRTAEGVRLRRLPDEADAIFRRLARDIAGLTPADVALVEDTARWVAVGKEAYVQMLDAQKSEDAKLDELARLALTVTDTAHGNKEESRKNPLLIVMRTASEQIRANALQLGATPMARARLPEPAQQQMSLAEELFHYVDRDG